MEDARRFRCVGRTGGQGDEKQVCGRFEDNLLFEELCETLKQQSWLEGCHVIFQVFNFQVTSRLTFHVLRFTHHVPV